MILERVDSSVCNATVGFCSLKVARRSVLRLDFTIFSLFELLMVRPVISFEMSSVSTSTAAARRDLPVFANLKDYSVVDYVFNSEPLVRSARFRGCVGGDGIVEPSYVSLDGEIVSAVDSSSLLLNEDHPRSLRERSVYFMGEDKVWSEESKYRITNSVYSVGGCHFRNHDVYISSDDFAYNQEVKVVLSVTTDVCLCCGYFCATLGSRFCIHCNETSHLYRYFCRGLCCTDKFRGFDPIFDYDVMMRITSYLKDDFDYVKYVMMCFSSVLYPLPVSVKITFYGIDLHRMPRNPLTWRGPMKFYHSLPASINDTYFRSLRQFHRRMHVRLPSGSTGTLLGGSMDFRHADFADIDYIAGCHDKKMVVFSTVRKFREAVEAALTACLSGCFFPNGNEVCSEERRKKTVSFFSVLVTENENRAMFLKRWCGKVAAEFLKKRRPCRRLFTESISMDRDVDSSTANCMLTSMYKILEARCRRAFDNPEFRIGRYSCLNYIEWNRCMVFIDEKDYSSFIGKTGIDLSLKSFSC